MKIGDKVYIEGTINQTHEDGSAWITVRSGQSIYTDLGNCKLAAGELVVVNEPVTLIPVSIDTEASGDIEFVTSEQLAGQEPSAAGAPVTEGEVDEAQKADEVVPVERPQVPAPSAPPQAEGPKVEAVPAPQEEEPKAETPPAPDPIDKMSLKELKAVCDAEGVTYAQSSQVNGVRAAIRAKRAQQ